jgi:hypothetical protein
LYDIAKYTEAQHPRDQRGRWTRAAGAVVLRGTKIAAHAVHLHSAVTAAVNAPLPAKAIIHASTALARGDALLAEIKALPPEAEELAAASADKLRLAREHLLRLKEHLASSASDDEAAQEADSHSGWGTLGAAAAIGGAALLGRRFGGIGRMFRRPAPAAAARSHLPSYDLPRPPRFRGGGAGGRFRRRF